MEVAMQCAMLPKSIRVSDAHVALALVVMGVTGIVVGFATVAHPFDISPSLDGTLTAVQLGFVLALLHGLPFRRVLAIMAPVVGVLFIAAMRQHESAVALVGVSSLFYGLAGLGLSLVTRTRANAANIAQLLHSNKGR